MYKTNNKILLVSLLISLALAGSVISTSLIFRKNILEIERKDDKSTIRLENIVQNEDILDACVLLAQDYYHDINQQQVNRVFEKMVDEIKMQTKDTQDPHRIVTIINEYLFHKLGIKAVGSVSSSVVLPNKVFENKKGHCLGLSVIYLSIAERLQINIFARIVPEHIFLSYDDGTERFNIETTSDGANFPDSHYYYYLPCPQDRLAQTYLRKLSKRELLGVFLANLGNSLQENTDALDAQKKALELFPEFAEIHTNIATLYLRLGNSKKAKNHLTKAIKLDPTLWQAHSSLANLYFVEGNYVKSIEANLKNINLLYKSAKIHANVLGLPENESVIEFTLVQNKFLKSY